MPEPQFIDTDHLYQFPDPETAYQGIVAYGDEIQLQTLYSAYCQGIFPWFDETRGEPVLWWCPDPRFVLKIEDLHIPQSLTRFLKKTPYTYTMDRDFRAVMESCAAMKRPGQNGTWIGPKMIAAYSALHEAGFAHSVEVWHGSILAGGLYGVLLGSVFCGESMFTAESNSAKSAFALFARAFAACGGRLIDSQVYTDNIARYGAQNIPRTEFLALERQYLAKPLTADIQRVFADTVQKECIS